MDSMLHSALWPWTVVLAPLFFLWFSRQGYAATREIAKIISETGAFLLTHPTNRESEFLFQFPASETGGFSNVNDHVEEQKFQNVQVTKILVHPIKSCKGTSVRSVKYTSAGLENDRKWCIIEAENYSIITARTTANMVLIHPRIEEDNNLPYGGTLDISFPESSGCERFSVPLRPTEDMLRSWELTSRLSFYTKRGIDGYICQSVSSAFSETARSPSEILSKYFGRPVHLVFKGPLARPCAPTKTSPDLSATISYQDGYPLLVLSEESVEAVQGNITPLIGTQGIEERWRDMKLEIERFRPNIVMKGARIPFAEDTWEEIAISPQREFDNSHVPTISLVSKCSRCLLPNVDNKTGIRDKAVPFKVLMKFRTGVDPENKNKAMLGCNAVPSGSGTLNVGDWVHIRKFATVY